MTYDFSNLTTAQQGLLTFGGWSPGCKRPQPGPRTVKKLIERGLLDEREVSETVSGGRFRITVKAYIVPTAVHIDWCAHCAEVEEKRSARAGGAA